MRIIFAIGLLTAATITHAVPAEPLAAMFETALAQGKSSAAAKAFDAVYEARIAAVGVRAGDATLDGMYGRYLNSINDVGSAQPYLIGAIAGTSDPAGKAVLELALGQAREVMGQLVSAEEAYRAVLGGGPDAATGRTARYALARLVLGRAPDEAAALLRPALAEATTAGERWEGHLLLSRAEAIAGRRASARALLEQAWSEAPAAPQAATAIIRTAHDLAIDGASSRRRSIWRRDGWQVATFTGRSIHPPRTWPR